MPPETPSAKRADIATEPAAGQPAEMTGTRPPRRLWSEIAEAELRAAERERTRISHDLHDGLGQHLTGIAFLCKALARRLDERKIPEAADAERIAGLVNQAVADAQALARGLQPVGPEDNALWAALGRLAGELAEIYGIDCAFHADGPILVASRDVSLQLYRIAQEAVHNAIKHGHAGPIAIDLQETARTLVLSVSNSGNLNGLPGGGIGVGSMRERARLIGARLALTDAGDGQVRLRVTIARERANAKS